VTLRVPKSTEFVTPEDDIEEPMAVGKQNRIGRRKVE
jgi:hypothetical protein